jgi:phosphatidylserine/phosphatidylglycerophosphate/cardiolipin synthase-like enzyme
MRGEICEKLLDFWFAFWSRGVDPLPLFSTNALEPSPEIASEDQNQAVMNKVTFSSSTSMTPTTKTVLLPSPHRSSPNFRPLWLSPPEAPPTPLNTFLLHVFSTARNNIFIQTPNVTSPPLIEALFSALKLGVNIHLITSSKLMILEQLVTAGTITEFELWRLRRRYRSLVTSYTKTSTSDPEAQVPRPGNLKIGYYHPRMGSWDPNEPVKSHLKCVIVDEEITVLGSGNMDRASWFTSQELGIAFFSADMARDIRACVDEGLEGRVDYVC